MNELSSIKEGDKFAAICVRGMSLEAGERAVVDLDEEVSAHVRPALELPEQWRTWLGTLKSEQIADTEFMIVARKPSAKPHEMDKDTQDVSNAARWMWEGLCVSNIPFVDAVHFLTGARIEGQVKVRQSYGLPAPLLTMPKEAAPMTIDEVKVGHEVFAGLRAIRSTTEYERLRKGHRALQAAIHAQLPDDRLHQFVRSIEAVVKPGRQNGTKEFGERCARGFLSGSAHDREMMALTYDLRSVIEHMSSIEELVRKCRPRENVDDVFTRFLYRAEGLACALYSYLLKTKDARDVFRLDDTIDGLWSDLGAAPSKLGFHYVQRSWPPRAPQFITLDPNWKTKIRSANAKLKAEGAKLSVAVRSMDAQRYNWYDGQEALRLKFMISLSNSNDAAISGAYLQCKVREMPCDHGENLFQWSCQKGWKHDKSESSEGLETQAEVGHVLEKGAEVGLVRVELHLTKPFLRPLVLQFRYGSDLEALHTTDVPVSPETLNATYDSVEFGDSQPDPLVAFRQVFSKALPKDGVCLGVAWPERT